MGTAYGFGAIIGPVIGGALAFPCEAVGHGFPLCGEGQLNTVRYAPTMQVSCCFTDALCQRVHDKAPYCDKLFHACTAEFCHLNPFASMDTVHMLVWKCYAGLSSCHAFSQP